ncbi:adrenodoxin-like [Pelodytes ibericus]
MARRAAGLIRTLLSGQQGAVSPQCYSVSRTLPRCSMRHITTTARCQDTSSGAPKDTLTVNFINRNGENLTATAKDGESLLDLVSRHNLPIDGFGACEGTLACSTCHLIFEQNIFDQLSSVSDEEMDMLDLAFALTDTSRLGCQICMNKALDGMTVRVPKDISDARKDVGTVQQ